MLKINKHFFLYGLIVTSILSSCDPFHTAFQTRRPTTLSSTSFVIDSITDASYISYPKSTFFKFEIAISNISNDTLTCDLDSMFILRQEENNYKIVKYIDYSLQEYTSNHLLRIAPRGNAHIYLGYESHKHWKEKSELNSFVQANPLVLNIIDPILKQKINKIDFVKQE